MSEGAGSPLPPLTKVREARQPKELRLELPDLQVARAPGLSRCSKLPYIDGISGDGAALLASAAVTGRELRRSCSRCSISRHGCLSVLLDGSKPDAIVYRGGFHSAGSVSRCTCHAVQNALNVLSALRPHGGCVHRERQASHMMLLGPTLGAPGRTLSRNLSNIHGFRSISFIQSAGILLQYRLLCRNHPNLHLRTSAANLLRLRPRTFIQRISGNA